MNFVCFSPIKINPSGAIVPLEKFDPYSYDGVVYATQGGGYATLDHASQIVWLAEIPNFIDAKVGDPIPEEWSVTSITDPFGDHQVEQIFAEEWV